MPMLAIADDLTGAAEIAGIGHRHGWRAQIVTRLHGPDESDLTVLDTDTRLVSPGDAGHTLAEIGAVAARHAWRLVYKKTDSVLRGPVLAELVALAAALGKQRVLLVPANPSLGRIIRDGRYFVREVPLHETAFARDPHHPARTAIVSDLLGTGAPVTVLRPDAALPASGIVVGEAQCAEDVHAWARRVDDDTLPAGGGDFFTAVMRVLAGEKGVSANLPDPGQPALLVCGSTAAPRRAPGAITLPPILTEGDDPAEVARWSGHILELLARQPFVAVQSAPERLHDSAAPRRIRLSLTQLVQRTVAADAVRHVMIEGGATAAAILGACGWTRLVVAREWAQGVVTLQPVGAEHPAVTMKPGSYHWPENLWTGIVSPK